MGYARFIRVSEEDKISRLRIGYIVRSVIIPFAIIATDWITRLIVHVIDKTTAIKPVRAASTPNIGDADKAFCNIDELRHIVRLLCRSLISATLADLIQ